LECIGWGWSCNGVKAKVARDPCSINGHKNPLRPGDLAARVM
jgi:hypothetical protein